MSADQVPGAHSASAYAAAKSLGDRVLWDSDSVIVTVAADRSLGSAVRRVCDEKARWVVVVHALPDTAEVYYYTFLRDELECALHEDQSRRRWTIARALNLTQVTCSRTSRGRRLIGPACGEDGTAAGRVIDFDAAGRVVAIGELGEATHTWSPDVPFDLRPKRGAAGLSATTHAGEIEVTLSAETQAELELGAEGQVSFRIDLSSEAAPLAASLSVGAQDKPIAVSLTAETDSIEIVRDQQYTVDPPAPGQSRTGLFLVKGIRSGLVRLAVAFRQGGTELGVIGLAVEVVVAAARPERARGDATAAPRDLADDDKVMLQVVPCTDGGQMFYEYFLHSEELGLIHRVRSSVLLDRGGGPAATLLAFVERIYERVTKELNVLDLQRELQELQRETRALGASLCRELFEPAVTKILWPLRHRIKQVQIVSWEPYIPWEMVCLRDPESGDIDDRFLAEYGLVRTLAGEMPARELPMRHWAYLGAVFPSETLPSVGAEMGYFKGKSAESLQGHGIDLTAIRPTRDAFYDALADLDFDVLHISCHATSPHKSIERAGLIIGEETPPGTSTPRLVEVDTITVEAEAKLRRRRPLVFLNACETGREGAVLTAWGGWPNVFLRAGAGAFVGAAWGVRDQPAAAFSTSFYNALLDGKTLAEAASAARASAKKLGDASWLAFKVYGHPRARCVHTLEKRLVLGT